MQRLLQGSTWAGISAFLGAAMMAFPPTGTLAIVVQAAAAAAASVAVFLNDHKNIAPK